VDADALSETLNGVARGDSAAIDRLLPVVYQELRLLAASYLKGERPGHTLQPDRTRARGLPAPRTARRRLAGAHSFHGVAARAMRSVLVDHARRRKADKRGGGQALVPLDTSIIMGSAAPVGFDDLDRALQDLARLSERQARVVELRYFGGLSIEETAQVLGISPVTVKRDWALARAWLFRELTQPDA
jgi:RNA polymerase sigma factor (TIGR02999 family)